MVNPILRIYRKFHADSDDKIRLAQCPTSGVSLIKDIPYIDDGSRLHMLDAVYPEGTTGLLPIIINFHGGGWIFGEKSINENQSRYLANSGFAVFNVNYRLCPEVRFDGQVHDVFSILDWVARQAVEYHGDASKVFLTGDSAGGQLALFAAIAINSPKLQNIYHFAVNNIVIQAVAATCPVALLHQFYGGKGIVYRTIRSWMFGRHPERNPFYEFASLDDITTLGTFPDIMILTTKGDHYFYENTLALHKLFASIGITHVYREYESRANPIEHVFNVLHPDYSESMVANDDMADFFFSHINQR